MATADQIAFFYMVRTLTGEIQNADSVSTQGALDHLVRNKIHKTRDGVEWALTDEIGAHLKDAHPGETEFVPWWRVVRIKKLRSDKLTFEDERGTDETEEQA